MGVSTIARVPVDPNIVLCAEKGRSILCNVVSRDSSNSMDHDSMETESIRNGGLAKVREDASPTVVAFKEAVSVITERLPVR